MNREIKFRAWDKSCNKMRGTNGVKDCFAIRSDGSINYDFQLMQYTGLKDKNGVEIYEGDVIPVNIAIEVEAGEDFQYFQSDEFGNRKRINNTPKNCVIVFKDGMFGFLHKQSNYFKGVWIESLNKDKWEVIGNIYENPELLKQLY